MGGLLHDIGKTVIETYFPDQQDMEHTEVGSWMAERWQLPDALINAIAFHHSLAPEHLAQPVTACVHAGNMCAKRALTSSTADLDHRSSGSSQMDQRGLPVRRRGGS